MTKRQKTKAIEEYLAYLNDLSMKIYGVPVSDGHARDLRDKYQNLFEVT